MNILGRLLPSHERKNGNRELVGKREKSGFSSEITYTGEENFNIFDTEVLAGDSYLFNAWVNIAVNILIRNIARADFAIKKGGNDVRTGSLYELFRRPNSVLSRYDLWKETAAWWHLEGEAFWWFGPDYAGGAAERNLHTEPQETAT
jgi:hypothetical protein